MVLRLVGHSLRVTLTYVGLTVCVSVSVCVCACVKGEKGTGLIDAASLERVGEDLSRVYLIRAELIRMYIQVKPR
jgi:hypothetical protein